VETVHILLRCWAAQLSGLRLNVANSAHTAALLGGTTVWTET
jgi:hypothetical protein